MDEINLKGKGDKFENEIIKYTLNEETKNRMEEWDKINFSRLSNKINKVGSLEKMPWKNELESITNRIIPGKTFNLWEESLEKEYFQRPKGEKLLSLIRYLENTKLKIIHKSSKETKELEIDDLDMIEFLDRDFLFLGYVKDGSDIVDRKQDEYEWFCGNALTSVDIQVSSIHHMITVINNKIFYLEKFIWELDDYMQFTPNFYYSIIVFDIPSNR